MQKVIIPVFILITIVIMNIIPGGCMNSPFTPTPGVSAIPAPIPVDSTYVKGLPFINSLKCVVNSPDTPAADKNSANQLILTSEEALKSSKDGSIFVNSKDFLYFSKKYPNCNFSG